MSDNEIETTDRNDGAYFGMPCLPDAAALVIVSAPWDVTAPEGSSSSYAPDAIIEESLRMDLYDPLSPDEWRKGIATADIDYTLQEISHGMRQDVERLRSREEKGGGLTGLADDYYARKMRRIDEECVAMLRNIRSQMAEHMRAGRIAALVGGDQSAVFGALCAAAESHEGVGVLHIDALCRMKSRHEGFEHSAASTMFDASEQIEGLGRIVHVGVREMSATEHRLVRESEGMSLFDADRLSAMRYEGMPWRQVCDAIVAELPHEVFVDLDISVLRPDNCPHSPEAVAGGLDFDGTVYLIDRVVRSGRRIVGFALTGVSPASGDSTDARVGARMLYRMCGIALRSQNNG